MREFPQTNGRRHRPAGWKPPRPPGGSLRLAWIAAAAWLLLAQAGAAQTLRLGLFDLFILGRALVAYDSNVDDAYPEEENPDLQKGDFYWMPGLSIRSQPVAMSPRTTFNFAAGYDYMDYFVRNDLDTEVYNASLNVQAVLPRLTLGGLVSTEYSIDASEDEYVPGGATRDPMRTDVASAFVNWNYRKVRVDTQASFTRERHDYAKYQIDDQDETSLIASAYLDLFSWGSLYYTWENTVTTLVLPEPDEETDETIRTFGLTGALPLSLLRRPQVSYSFGFSQETEQNETDGEDEEDEETWEPTHTLTVSDEFQLSKTVHLSASATWLNTVVDDEVSFLYNIDLTQQLGASAEHSLTFVQEPRSTFGSNTDTETTTCGYTFNVKDLFIYNLSLSFGATYALDTPLDVEEAITEKTTTMSLGLNHVRQLTRQLARILSYTYTYEDSNFHDYGPNQKHLLTYGFTYDF